MNASGGHFRVHGKWRCSQPKECERIRAYSSDLGVIFLPFSIFERLFYYFNYWGLSCYTYYHIRRKQLLYLLSYYTGHGFASKAWTAKRWDRVCAYKVKEGRSRNVACKEGIYVLFFEYTQWFCLTLGWIFLKISQSNQWNLQAVVRWVYHWYRLNYNC